LEFCLARAMTHTSRPPVVRLTRELKDSLVLNPVQAAH
jgi:hypothetical protein